MPNFKGDYWKLVAEIEYYAILPLALDGTIMNWNKGAEKIMGYPAGEITGKKIHLFYTEEDRAKMLPDKLLAKAANEDKAMDEGWQIRKGGSRFWGSMLITATIYDPILRKFRGGRSIGFFCRVLLRIICCSCFPYSQTERCAVVQLHCRRNQIFWDSPVQLRKNIPILFRF